MKSQTLPTKRRPAPNGLFKRLNAITGNRKQRVAATATADMEIEDGSSKISRALTIIFLIHIVAIGLIFVHQRFLDGRTPSDSKTVSKKPDATSAISASATQRLDLPRIESNEKPYIVRQGDNYARIATAIGVDEGDLRLANKHADIVPGLLLKVPPKRAVIAIPLVTIPDTMPEIADTSEEELLETAPFEVSNAPRAKVVQPVREEVVVQSKPKNQTKPRTPAASAKNHIVKNGDSIWRIANKYKVNQAALMKANGISDGSKIKAGMNLVIPH
jgi:LysM repeat protein